MRAKGKRLGAMPPGKKGYHTAPRSALKAIRRKGLLPQSGSATRPDDEVVFFAEDAKGAYRYFIDREDADLLRFPFPVDAVCGRDECITLHPIPPDALELYTGKALDKLRSAYWASDAERRFSTLDRYEGKSAEIERARKWEPLTKANLGALPKSGRGLLSGVIEDLGLTLEEDVSESDDMLDVRLYAVNAKGDEVGLVHAAHGGGRFAAIEDAKINEAYRGKGLYPTMLMEMLNTLKGYGVKGIVSTPEARVGDDSRRSWEKFSKRSNRVRQVEDEEGSTFFLEGLGALPKSGRIPLSGVVEDLGLTLKAGKRDEMPVIRALRNGEEVGFVGYSACAKGQYAQIEDAFISPRVQGYGLYPALLSALRNKVKAKGCKGIISTDRTPEATASWEKFAQREPRVRRDGDTFTLEGLPKSGRIPLSGLSKSDTARIRSIAEGVRNRLGRCELACVNHANVLRDELRKAGFSANRVYGYLLSDGSWGDGWGRGRIEWGGRRPKRGGELLTDRHLDHNWVEVDGLVVDTGAEQFNPLLKTGQFPPVYIAPLSRATRYDKRETLGALPKSGRIPIDTAKRVLKRLPAKTRACGFSPAALREGMEIEREHRDVTKGGVLATAKIAAAHLCERKDYYKRIKRFVEN
jgi:hypothetical protein